MIPVAADNTEKIRKSRKYPTEREKLVADCIPNIMLPTKIKIFCDFWSEFKGKKPSDPWLAGVFGRVRTFLHNNFARGKTDRIITSKAIG